MLRIVISFCCLLLLNVSYSQNVITQVFKPGPVEGQDAVIFKTMNSCIPSSYNTAPEYLNFGDTYDLSFFEWTFNAQGCARGTGRSLLKFSELDLIPSNATITYARLDLYGVSDADFMDKGNNYYPGSPYPLPNNGLLYKISNGAINDWNEQTVTWNSAESLNLEPNPIAIPPSSSKWGWDYSIVGPELEQMIQNMLGTGNNNGFLLKLDDENYYRALNFASSNHPDSTLWPELTIEYIINCDASFNYTVNSSDLVNYQFNVNNNVYSDYNWYVNNIHVGSGTSMNYNFNNIGDYEVCLAVNTQKDKCMECIKICINNEKKNKIKEDNENMIYNNEYGILPIQGDDFDLTKSFNLQVFPNPVIDMLNIFIESDVNEKIDIFIYDAMGKKVYNKNEILKSGNNKYSLNFKDYSTGIYIIEVSSKNNKNSFQVIKE